LNLVKTGFYAKIIVSWMWVKRAGTTAISRRKLLSLIGRNAVTTDLQASQELSIKGFLLYRGANKPRKTGMLRWPNWIAQNVVL
jgi:hypothetical protein